MENEGGVFSGVVTGIAHGWSGSPDASANTFIRSTNYVENANALTDNSGTLIFTVKPTSTAVPKGFYNADFNGLQIMRAE